MEDNKKNNLVRFTKETALFIKGTGSTYYVKGEYWHHHPFWYKSTDKEDVFEQVTFENLPDYLKKAIEQFRSGEGILSAKINNKNPFTDEFAFKI